MTHANYAATGTSVFALGDTGHQALAYGGYHAPRAMASTTLSFVGVALAFLRLFYLHYSDLLEELSLLWQVDVGESGLTWEQMIAFFERWAESVHEEILALPEDEVPTTDWFAGSASSVCVLSPCPYDCTSGVIAAIASSRDLNAATTTA